MQQIVVGKRKETEGLKNKQINKQTNKNTTNFHAVAVNGEKQANKLTVGGRDLDEATS